MIAGIAVLGKDNNPLYIRSFGSHDALRFHFIVHTALDFVEEKIAAQRQQTAQQQLAAGGSTAAKHDCFLGLLYPIEELRVYGFQTNCRTKLIVVLDEEEVKEAEMRALFRRLQGLYIDAICNPFHVPDSELYGNASFRRQVERLAEAGLY